MTAADRRGGRPPRPDEDDGPGPGLDDLIRAGMQERGWSYSDLERVSDRALTRGRWQQLGSGVPQRKFPEPGSLTVIARVLEVDMTTVVLAAARSLGLEVDRRGAELAELLPVSTDRISERMRDAILTLIRSAVAEAPEDDDLRAGSAGPQTLGHLHPQTPRGSASEEHVTRCG